MTPRLAFTFSALIALIVAVGWLCLDRMAAVNANIQEVVDRRWQKVQLARDALRYSSLNSRVTMQVFLTEDPREIGSLLALRAKNTDRISALVAKIEPQIESDDERKLMGRVEATRTLYVESYKNALNVLLEEGKQDTARAMMANTVLPYLIAYHNAWDAFVDYQGERMNEAGDIAEQYAAVARREVLSLLVAGVLLAVGISAFVMRSMASEAARRQRAERELVVASRQAGMAEIATGVLHNVKNVLNSVGIASASVTENIKRSRAANLSKIVALIREHEADLGAFLTSDPKGKQIPVYLARLGEMLVADQTDALNQLADVQRNLEHVKEIVTAQQHGAKSSGQVEPANLADLVEDALRMDPDGHPDGGIRIVKQFEAMPPLFVQKHLVLQILVNLIRNAKQACHAADRAEKSITLRIVQEGDRARVSVIDSGVGVAPENLDRIFTHGFSTKKDGHGFGLHSALFAAQDLGGTLHVASQGLGRGATFTLELPLHPDPKPTTSAPTTVVPVDG